jgi:hypothetical protein
MIIHSGREWVAYVQSHGEAAPARVMLPLIEQISVETRRQDEHVISHVER